MIMIQYSNNDNNNNNNNSNELLTMASNLQLQGTVTQNEKKINDNFTNLLHQNVKIKRKNETLII